MVSKLDSKRVRALKRGEFSGNSVLYWMNRDKRVDDNWAMIGAQSLALKHHVPLIVCFQYVGNFPDSNIRQYGFLFRGLLELKAKLEKLNIEFVLSQGETQIDLLKIIEERSVGTMIVDHSPLKVYQKRINNIVDHVNIPIYQIDAHNIVPVWVASQKKEYAAYTIRKKIHNNLDQFLTDYPKVIRHPYGDIRKKDISYDNIINKLNIDFSIKEVDWLTPGETAAKNKLNLLSESLNGYDQLRNDPTKEALSNLSPYFHFGHISPQRVAFEIRNSVLTDLDKNSFLEEMIIRRELADNFCEYEPNYDYFDGFHDWAKKSLNEHRNDEREFLYPKEQFELSETHDPLWNAAQNQMRKKGKMHGYMRMYWAKKILEWSPNPEVAMQIAIDLNDTYELDGRDPNGYTGIAWSIGGIHDRAWFDRPVYGKIRYMNYNGCKSKFNVKRYIEMYESC